LPRLYSPSVGILKAYDLITSPAFIVIKAADEFKDKTTAPNQLWQSDLLSALKEMCKIFEVQLVSHEDAALAQVLRFMKADAAKTIRYERLGRRSLASKHQKASSWPYDWNETDLAKARSPDDIKFMFQQLKMDVDYEALAARARERVAQRVAKAVGVEADDGIPFATDEELFQDLKEQLAKKRKPSFLQRRKQLLDFT
jgi:hypothetical protein